MAKSGKVRFRKSARCALAALLISGVGLAASAVTYNVVLDKPSGIYSCGETAVFTVTLLSTDGLSAGGGAPCIRLDNFGTSVLTNMPFDAIATTPNSGVGRCHRTHRTA